MTANSRILIDGDRFRTESPEATYEGVFNINVEAQPHEIDIEFIVGPEAGEFEFRKLPSCISRLFELCLAPDANADEFCTSPVRLTSG